MSSNLTASAMLTDEHGLKTSVYPPTHPSFREHIADDAQWYGADSLAQAGQGSLIGKTRPCSRSAIKHAGRQAANLVPLWVQRQPSTSLLHCDQRSRSPARCHRKSMCNHFGRTLSLRCLRPQSRWVRQPRCCGQRFERVCAQRAVLQQRAGGAGAQLGGGPAKWPIIFGVLPQRLAQAPATPGRTSPHAHA